MSLSHRLVVIFGRLAVLTVILVGAEAMANGYDVAWKDTTSGNYQVALTDSSGNIFSWSAVISATSAALETYETSFHQDLNGDGLIDVFITHLTEETHTLWLQGPRGAFRDRTALSGLVHPLWRGTGFGTVLADFDHDGAPDLAIVNGRVREGPAENEATLGPFWSRYAEHNQLFGNDGQGRFRDLSEANEAFCGTAGVSRGLVVGDVNGDGALDLLVTKVTGRARLFRNVAARRGPGALGS